MRDAARLQTAVHGCDAVFHLAGQADLRLSLADHYGDLNSNVVGMVNLLEAMKKEGVNSLVFASSSAVYGEADVTPTPETCQFAPVSLYAASKAACEVYASAFTQLSDLRICSMRISQAVGERCRRGVIWDFVHRLSDNPRVLFILGDGKQLREYTYVSDVVEGFLAGWKNIGASRSQALNLAHSERMTVDQVADVVIEEMGLKDVERRYSGGAQGWVGDQPIALPSNEKLRSLGWEPRVSAKEAIKRTVRWTLDNL
jgi:UDP-glucose 4-epimerase